MKYIATIVFVWLGFMSKAQPNLLGVWPVGVPLSYINWYDDDSYTIDTTGIWLLYHHANESAIVSDSSHELLFQSNCCKIANKLGHTIENGDSIVDAKYYDSYGIAGSTMSQGIIGLPRDADTWWVFNMSFSDTGWANGTTNSPDRLYAAIVDVKANNGAGKVIAKKIPIYKGIMGDCRLTACRHANGRDWWLVNHGWNNAVYNKWLVTPDSVYGVFKDTIGTLHQELDIFGMAQFSLDGNRYAMGSGNGLVNVFDFDRCSGKFSNLRTINNYVEPPWIIAPYISSVTGLCLSPSGRFLYASAFDYVAQYDLDAANIDSSRVLLAKQDSTYSNPDPFYTMALSPTGKVVVSNFQGTFSSPYHIIQNPDSGGLTCHFEKEALNILGSFDNYTLPNLVNLKLGVAVGSGCDTITGVGKYDETTVELIAIQVFPNPASDKVFIEMSNSRSFFGELSIVDNLGEIVYRNNSYEGATMINVANWFSGIYYYQIKSDKAYTTTGKFVIIR